MRVTTRPLSGTAEAWNPANPEPFKALAGDRFLGTDGQVALVRTREGRTERVYPGWLAVRADGTDGVSVVSETEVGDHGTWAVTEGRHADG